MDAFVRYRCQRRRLFPYFVGACLVIGLSHEKRTWKTERSTDWFDHIVLETFDDDQWIENFRMKRETFASLCRDLETSLAPIDHAVRDIVDVQNQVAITLYWLASSAEYRTIGNLFGVGKSTVSSIVHKVCEAIYEDLLNVYVKFPTGDELKNVVRGYEESWGFPNCGGAIDGTYLNRKGYYSLIMQGVCDNKYIFRDITIRWPGRVHDARVFVNSEIFHKRETSTLFPNWLKRMALPGKETHMPTVLLGDPAYPLKPWLMKPFSIRGNLTPTQNVFNYRLSRARLIIENSFGRLKGRWRCLLKRLDVEVTLACTVITVCVILLNICEIHHERYIYDWNEQNDEDVDNNQVDDDDTNRDSLTSAKYIRDDIAVAFASGLF